MPEAKTIVRNTGFLFVSEVLVRIFSLFLIIFMAKYLGDAESGKYFFAVSYISIFQVLADIGLITLMFREIAANREAAKKYFDNVFTMKLILLVVSLAVSLLAFPLLYPGSAGIFHIIALTSLYFFFVGMISPFNILFNAYEKLEYYAIVTLCQTVIAASAAMLLMVMGFGLVHVLLALIASYFISFIVAAFLARSKFVRFGLSFDFGFWKELIPRALPFFMTGIFMIVYSSVDNLMLKYYRDYSVIGLYNFSLRLVESLNFIPFIIIGAVFPAMAALHASSRQLLGQLYERTFYYLIVLAIPIAIGTTLLADRIILFFYGPEMLAASFALKVLIWSAALLFVNFAIGYLLNAIHKAHLFTVSAGISLAANVILNILLIPLFPSYEGAAFSIVISQLINFIILYYFSLRSGYQLDLNVIWKPLLASAVMGASIFFLSFIHLLVLIPLACTAYGAVLFLLGGIGKQEIELVKGMLKF